MLQEIQPFLEELGWYDNDNVKISSLQEEDGIEYYVLEISNDSGELPLLFFMMLNLV